MTDAHEIIAVRGARRWDSRGRPTVEVEIRTPTAVGRAIAPAGASTGTGEAVDLRDGGPGCGGADVTTAVRNVDTVIAQALIGRRVDDQVGIDTALEAIDGTGSFATLGGNAAVATSMAAAHTAAAVEKLPLWKYLNPNARQLPLPEIQIFGGGAHAHGRIDLQDLMVVPYGAHSFAEAVDWAVEIHRAGGRWLDARGRLAGVADEGGWWPAFDSNVQALDALVASIEDAGLVPGDQVGISIDVAATQFVTADGYRLASEDRDLDRDSWREELLTWLSKYPIASIEDPFAEDDPVGMQSITAAVGDRVQVVGDDFLVTNADRVRTAAAAHSVNSVLIKPNQAGTLTRAKAALDAASEEGLGAIVSARSGETEDVTIAHLAVGWASGGFKVGSVTRSERTAKWNEMIRIEEEIGSSGRFVGRAGLGPWLR
ncbi:phosphopyruvate hydratase [Prescottella subtropica]|uniref:phosphopyruvate hydratase n=1 Tax=Prescottella subtropica TaxID=2545757 RepID=UPI0010F5940F|nr:enolase C-terminal domain-like protein [Prescottella subtropica]